MNNSLSSSSMEWRTIFDNFCRSTYIEESELYNDTVCKEIGERVMHLLKGKPSPALEHDPFHVWVRTKGFALTSYPLLGLREVLCVPASTTESVRYKEQYCTIIINIIITLFTGICVCDCVGLMSIVYP